MTHDTPTSAEREKLRMNAYYYSFEPTGVIEIDRVLSAVADAGKGCHHTADWSEYGYDTAIQELANAAAAAWNRRAAMQTDEPVAVPTREEALADTDQVPYLIYFDDADRKPEPVVGGKRARYRFSQVSISWNAHLFAKIASNSRDDAIHGHNYAAPDRAPSIELTGDDAEEVKQIWQRALADAAFYVEGHCASGEHHAETIMSMALPKITQRAPSTGTENIRKWALENETTDSEWSDGYESARRWVRMQLSIPAPKIDTSPERVGSVEVSSTDSAADGVIDSEAVFKASADSVNRTWNAAYRAGQQDSAAAWIIVDKRMPGDGQDVIILFWPFDNHENAQIVGQAHHIDGVFYTDDGEDHHYPSHWMPLPPPPVAALQREEGAEP